MLGALQKVFKGNFMWFQTSLWAHIDCQDAFEPYKEYDGFDGMYGW